ncbi:MAG: flagellin [bacterium]|jgi:flagellin
MSLRINQNVSAVNAHRNLLANDQKLSKSLERLSSGLRINRAADGPSALVTSEQMRAQIAGIDQAIKNSEVSISMIQTAESALNEVNQLMVGMRQLAIHASNEGANDDIMLQADQQEIANALASIDRVSTNTQFGTKTLLDGSNGANGVTSGAGLDFIDASPLTKGSATGYEVKVLRTASKSNLSGTAALTESIIEEGEILILSEGGKNASYTTTEFDSAETVAQNLGAAARSAGLDLSVKLSPENTLTVEHNKYGSKHSFQASSSSDGVLSTTAGSTISGTAGRDLLGTINGETATGHGQTMTGIRGNRTTDGLTVRFGGDLDVNGEGKPTADPENGVAVGSVNVTQNSLNFQVGANRGQTVSVSLDSTSTTQLSKNIENMSNFGSLSEIDVMTTEGAQDTITLIDEALNQVSQKRADLGSFQKNTLESNLSNLRTASENLVAAESSIRDADMAAEVAEFTRNKIMQKSATAMLAQANQAPTNILRLLD